MKKLKFIKLQLISRSERAAFALEFHRKITVISGENDVGKSSLIKSIYWVFGAEAAQVHPSWKGALSSGLMRFCLDDKEFSILREGNQFAIFDSEDRLLHRSQRITSELGPFLAKMFDFNIVLSSRNSAEPTIPPPSFCFLPFYIDQDVGWNQPWQSFSGLKQFQNWKRDVIFYHSGIRPNRFYELKAEMSRIKYEREQINTERSVVSGASLRIERKVAIEALSINIEEYDEAIQRLLKGLKNLRDRRQAYSLQISNIIANQSALQEQLFITQRALKEYDGDVKWLLEHTEEHLICPMCGVEHDNDFSTRFGLLEDREACRNLALNIIERLCVIRQEIGTIQNRSDAANEEINEIEEALAEKRGALALRDVIQAEGTRQASTIFQNEISKLSEAIGGFDLQIAEVEASLKQFTDPKHREKVESFYAKCVGRFLQKLNVKNISFDDIVRIDKSIRDTGSDQPRAVLSYFLAFLRTAFEFSETVFAPVVIDSPIQQDQDETNAHLMIDAILKDRPDDSQLILGTVSLHGNDVDGKIIYLKNENKLLDGELFVQIEGEFAKYSEALLAP